MAGLKETTAKLAHYRRQFEKLIAAAAAATRQPVPSASPGRLKEVARFGSNPGNLRMLTYVPASCRPGASLVVVLHGCTQTAEGYDAGAGWSTLAERHGFALLFAEQRPANNPKTCFNWFLPGDIGRGEGEALSIRQMVERLVTVERLDRERIFVTGLSAGGAMAAVMLAAYPEIFAGGAVIAGLPYGAAGNVQEALELMFRGKRLSARGWGDLVRRATPHQGAWPKVSIWYGTADATVKPTNAQALVSQWTNVHGLSRSPNFEDRVDGYPHRVWVDGAGEPLVESYTITGLAHGTPIAAGADPENVGIAAPFILEAGISSSYRIAQFWGIADGEAKPHAAAMPPRRAPEARPFAPLHAAELAGTNVRTLRPPTPRTSKPQPEDTGGSGFDPANVIDAALRRAGLLK